MNAIVPHESMEQILCKHAAYTFKQKVHVCVCVLRYVCVECVCVRERERKNDWQDKKGRWSKRLSHAVALQNVFLLQPVFLTSSLHFPSAIYLMQAYHSWCSSPVCHPGTPASMSLKGWYYDCGWWHKATLAQNMQDNVNINSLSDHVKFIVWNFIA
jgi:hypothetical protein